MRTACIKINGTIAGYLVEHANNHYTFHYDHAYEGTTPVSLAMPTSQRSYTYSELPPFFDGLLPEGIMLETLLRQHKLNQDDYFAQLLAVGLDVVGAVTIEPSS